MKRASLITALYGLLVFIGGIMGHVKAASTVSLVMGILFGVLLLGASYLLYRKQASGAYAALCLLLLLDGFFTFRFLKTFRFFPSGLFALLTLLALVLLVLSLRKKGARRS
jgi:uncharacterized membrane protein (UPF0136 family)